MCSVSNIKVSWLFFFYSIKVKVIRVANDKILITRVIKQIPVWEKNLLEGISDKGLLPKYTRDS